MRSLSCRFAVAVLALPLFFLAVGNPAEAGRYRYAAPATCATGNCPQAARPQYAVPTAAPMAYYYRTAPTVYAAPQCARTAPAGYTADGRALYQPVYRVTTAPTSVVGQVANAVNPLAWVNAIRARHGLHALAYDPNLSAWARQNNAAQSRRGLGHHVMSGCPQISAGTQDPSYAANMWLASPAHRAYLLSRTATVAGID